MLRIEELIIDEDISVLQTMKKLDETGQRILFIAPEGKLKATVTDGDIRKYILRSGTLEGQIGQAANYQPISLSLMERSAARKMLEHHGIDALPLLDQQGKIADIVFASGVDVDRSRCSEFPVVIMAGGLGTRLYPYTKILPKPLIPVGEMPILEHIIHRFCEFGCRDFRLVVNYKKNMIKSYFSELEKGYHVSYVDEEEPLGTGGGLCLLKGQMNQTFFLSNCDILLDADYGDIAAYHKEKGNLITMVCAVKHFTVPYGVIELGQDGSIESMREKPEMNFLTNTGVYVVEPRVVEELEDGKKQGFTDIIEYYRSKGEKVGVYPISEQSWMDMGQIEELDHMRRRLEER
ncbi:MAG: NTP transferase domain-containing protein [Candidatus Fournierella pullistercoris]|uniref:NTP transferase domain-containing protein n=1 Tax=Candidatus Allofournierella pullistercoris TaxID=2838597 RepID=A0A948T2U6_9FIRM|nr:NTP transferase domain-containing protein [Candidatus Fournierella pullistercoris]